MAVVIVISCEFFPLTPSDVPFRAPGHMQTAFPDYRHFTARDYGSRLGVPRLLEALALVGAVATVVGAGYYLRVLARVWFAPPAATFDASAPAVTATVGLAGLLTFPVLALAFGPLQSLSEAAARASFLAP